MLWVSSLRRMVHSTSLRATGSTIVLCRSAAWVVLPLRAAVTASRKAAISVAEVKSLVVTVKRAEGGAERAVAPVRAGVESFADVWSGRGFGSGTPSAGYAAGATRRTAVVTRPARGRMHI